MNSESTPPAPRQPGPARTGQSPSANPPTVVFAHGFFNTPRCFWRFRRWSQERGWNSHFMDFDGAWGKASVEDLAVQLEEFVAENVAQDQGIHLVGFSLGGLVSKEVIRRGRIPHEVLSLSMLGTPHGGTFHAKLAPGPTLRDLRPGSELAAAQSDFDWAGLGIPILNLWTITDTVVVPARHARWEETGVRNVALRAWIHPLLLWNRSGFRLITTVVEEGKVPQEDGDPPASMADRRGATARHLR